MKFLKPLYILSLVFSLVLYIHVSGAAHQENDRRIIIVKKGISGKRMSSEWKDALLSRMSTHSLDSFARLKRALTKDEIAWKILIESKIRAWNTYRDSLAVLFPDVVLHDTIFVMLGYLGIDDGFTYGNRVVCLDLTALYRAYGNADLPENSNRIDKIFAHEYTHLLHKQWAKNANYKPVTFIDDILWECLYEGIGMFRSLNAKWLSVNNALPDITQSTLNDLYPVFVERMITIRKSSNLSDSEKERLHSNLSRGSVNQKWGAFPVAIWLMLEANEDEKNLAKWINKGPLTVISLAKKYLPADLKSKFSAVFQEY